ncbi:MAG: hypothetical protein AB1297_08045 [bacterium]
MITVKKISNSEFMVTVEERGSKTKHTVTLDDRYYQDLTKGEISKEELIKRSFEFLLKREPKESILSRFNLKVIKRYFPEYEQRFRVVSNENFKQLK